MRTREHARTPMCMSLSVREPLPPPCLSCAQFCVVYQKVSAPSENTAGGDSAWVTERRKIARHYLFGWFPLDVLSILPSSFDILPLLLKDDESSTAAEKLTGFRAIKALKLIKLVRLMRASRLLVRWKARVGLSHSTLTIISIIALLSFAAHLYAPDHARVSPHHASTCI